MDVDTEAKVYTISQSSDGPPSDKSSSRKGRETLQNIKLFDKIVLTASLGFWLFVLIIAIIGIVPLTQLIVGSIHKNSCPIDYRIPIYLIVAGVMGLVTIILSMCQGKDDSGACVCCNIVLGLFQFAWLITGSVWVYGKKSKVQFIYPDDTSNYCHSVAYNCAYATITIAYVFLFLAVCCGSGIRRS